MIPTVDENLLKMIENPDGSLELSEETLNQFAPVGDFQDPDMLFVLEDKSIKTSGKPWERCLTVTSYYEVIISCRNDVIEMRYCHICFVVKSYFEL